MISKSTDIVKTFFEASMRVVIGVAFSTETPQGYVQWMSSPLNMFAVDVLALKDVCSRCPRSWRHRVSFKDRLNCAGFLQD